MEWVLDIGNSFTKLGIFSKGQLVKHYRFDDDSLRDLTQLEKPERCIISATRAWPQHVRSVLTQIPNVLELNDKTPLPFINFYSTPETLGRDRIAGVAGAVRMFPTKPVLVIDAGTSITFDLVDAKGHYFGGSISPGLGMRYKALHDQTGKLPLVEHQPVDFDFGDSTKTAIQSGVFNGLVHEVNGTIQNFSLKYPDLVVALCGGDAKHLVNHLNYRIFALPNLVLLGLHQILTYNAN